MPWVTALVAMGCVAVALGMLAAGADPWAPSSTTLLRAGASYGPLSLGGQPWRLVSYSLVHVGVLHLIGNLVPLLVLGTLLEQRRGHAAIAIIGLGGAVAGGVVAAWWHPTVALAGASGALFGIAGALVVVAIAEWPAMTARARRGLALALAGFAILHLVVALTSSVTDQAAHLGGLIAGVVLAVALRRTIAVIAVVATLVLMIALGPRPIDQRRSRGNGASTSLRATVAELQAIDARFEALLATPPVDPAPLRAALTDDIVPAIDRAMSRLDAMPAEPRAVALRRYAAARRRAIALFADYLGTSNPALPAAIQAAQAEADVALSRGLIGDQPE